jgi:hypothetical protein
MEYTTGVEYTKKGQTATQLGLARGPLGEERKHLVFSVGRSFYPQAQPAWQKSLHPTRHPIHPVKRMIHPFLTVV